MAENSKIEWTNHTFNPWEGCQKVSPGCANCYAERRDQQYHDGEHWGPGGTRKMMSESYWKQPLKWNKRGTCRECGFAEVIGSDDCRNCGKNFQWERQRIFCASLADVFEDRPDLEVPRRRLFKVIQATPNLDWLLLTKRPENTHRLTYKAIDPFDDPDRENNIAGEPNGLDVADFGDLYPNVWLGTTVENQEHADKRIPELLKIPAKVRFLSCEPLLGSLDLTLLGQSGPTAYPFFDCLRGKENPGPFFRDAKIHWVIVGGESGSSARPMNPKWARSLRDQCQAAGVPCFFKQWGEWEEEMFTDEHAAIPDRRAFLFDDGIPMVRSGKKAAGRILDGRTWDELPALAA